MAFQRIPNEYDLNEIFMTPSDAAVAAGKLPQNASYVLRQLGVEIVRVGGRPMVYRQEFFAALGRRKAQLGEVT